MDTVSLKNLLKFVVGTLLGLFLVVIPLNFGKNVDTFTFYYLKKFVSWMGHPLEILMTTIIVLSAFIAWIDVQPNQSGLRIILCAEASFPAQSLRLL